MIVYYLFYNIILEFIVNKSRDFINYANTIFFPNFWTIIQEDQNPIFHIVLLLGNSTVCSQKWHLLYDSWKHFRIFGQHSKKIVDNTAKKY